MLKKIAFLMFLLAVLTISGCSKNQNDEVNNSNEVNKNIKLVYDGAKLIKFDMSEESALEPWDLRSNQFQYTFFKSAKYITSGNSISNNFEILKKAGDSYSSIYHLKSDKEALFPLASIGDEHLFIVVKYLDDTNELVDLLEIDRSGKIKKMNLELSDKAKKVFSGISTDNGDIYTLLHENKMANLYKTNKMLSEFNLIATDVDENSLSTNKEEIVYTKKNYLYSGTKQIKKLAEGTTTAKIISDTYLLQVMADGEFIVEDLSTNNILLSYNDYLGYQENNDKISFFTSDNVYELGGRQNK
ncbi:hypothetical protein [Listeria sp. ILCC792]|uniref:hypothetical protein n=1 Tax=Listeria sp. ILCC792 TaxID=1918331 RepID=UPI000B58A9CD|nr:hypothetical protein [Listeria sp. ILCC792]